MTAILVAAMGFGGLYAAQNPSADQSGIVPLVTGTALMIIALVPLVVAAFGLPGNKNWGRNLSDAAALEFPIGTEFAVWRWRSGRAD